VILGVAKVIELIGSSPNSFDDAVKIAVNEASKTIRNIEEILVKSLKAEVKNNEISEYQAIVKITFIVESTRKN
jgi:flavin-binding protein dodecin